MNTGFASHCLVLAMLAGLLPANSMAAKTNRAQELSKAAPTADVVQRSTSCAPATLDQGGRQQQLRNARRAYEHLRGTYADRFDDLEQVVKTLRSAEAQKVGDLMAKGIPGWLYCVVHPLWCRGL